MDLHQAPEPPTPAEDVFMSLPAGQSSTLFSIGAASIVAQEAPKDEPIAACASEDVEEDGDAHAQDSSSDVDNDGSDYLPSDVQGEDDSDADIPSSLKKHSRGADIDPVELAELHEEWDKWKNMYSDLLSKKETKKLSNSQKDDLAFFRRKLQELMKQVPASDPLKREYSKFLVQTQSWSSSEAHKRKNGASITGQVKKARLETPTQGRTNTRRAATQAITKQVETSAIGQYFHRLEEQVARSGPHSKRAKSELSNLRKALHAFGGEKLVDLKDGCWLIRGMKTPLFGYQFDGAGWMVQQERSRSKPDGGILADEMGCGKTITMLSVILRCKPTQKATVKSNLLLVQSDQMANQWMDQIEKHCKEESLPAFRWGRRSRLNAAVLGVDQIIVMTYFEVERAWSRVSQAREKAKKRSADNASQTADQEHLLFSTKFHRLVLDECQQIKNHNSRTAKAVFQLVANFQWLISATPAPNRPDEYYSYLKILQLPHTDSIRAFHKYWTKKPKAGERNELEKGLEKYSIHRTRQTTFAGVKIFDGVPDSIEETLMLDLSDEERIFYNVVVEPLRTELRKKKEQLVKKKDIGTLEDTSDADGASGGYMVSKILSLYKLTAHPFLLESIMLNDNFRVDQIRDIQKKLKLLNSDAQSMFLDQADHIAGQVVENIEAGRSMSLESHLHSTESQSLSDSDIFNVDLQMDYTLGEKAKERRCRLCPEITVHSSAVLTECGHYFCQEHFDDMCKLFKMKTPDEPIRCFVCKGPIGETRNVEQADLAAAYVTYQAAATSESGGKREGKSSKTKEKSGRKRGNDFNGCQPKGERSRFLELSDRDHLKVPLVHSSKTREMLKTILRWQDDAPDDKIIIFTQWLVMAKIIGRIIGDEGINFLYYFGDMTSSERTQNLETFRTDGEVKVIIMGFKCAGQGLDMPHANRVILVDPWWNEDGERQAFARVLRKVQKKMTFFIRLIIEESIDMRISDIQQSKREMSQRLMKEDDPWRREMIGLEYASKILDQATSVMKSKAVGEQEDTSDGPMQVVAAVAEESRNDRVEA